VGQQPGQAASVLTQIKSHCILWPGSLATTSTFLLAAGAAACAEDAPGQPTAVPQQTKAPASQGNGVAGAAAAAAVVAVAVAGAGAGSVLWAQQSSLPKGPPPPPPPDQRQLAAPAAAAAASDQCRAWRGVGTQGAGPPAARGAPHTPGARRPVLAKGASPPSQTAAPVRASTVTCVQARSHVCEHGHMCASTVTCVQAQSLCASAGTNVVAQDSTMRSCLEVGMINNKIAQIMHTNSLLIIAQSELCAPHRCSHDRV